MKFTIFEIDTFLQTLLRLEQWQERLTGTRQTDDIKIKISQIFKYCLYLPFFLLFILWVVSYRYSYLYGTSRKGHKRKTHVEIDISVPTVQWPIRHHNEDSIIEEA